MKTLFLGRNVSRAALSAAVLAACAGGCARTASPRPLRAEQFVGRRAGPVENAANEVVQEQPGFVASELRDDRIAAGNPGPGAGGAAGAPTPPAARAGAPAVSDVVRDAIQPPAPVTADVPSPAGGAGRAGPAVGTSSGQYLVLGSVVAEVNGTPIYANKVLSLLEKPLQEKAKTLPPQQFQEYATTLIFNQVNELVHEELEFAAAQRSIEADDQRIADALTQVWRKQKISEAGGSLQVARKRSQADNALDFDEAVQQQYRTNIVRIYYERKVYPRIQVTAEDMRRYYQQHLDKQFSEHVSARFRLIKVDPEKQGGREKALARAKAVVERARKGEDFAVMATKENDESLFADRGGFPMKPGEYMEKGSFFSEAVEQEVWKLKPGEVSDVISDGGAYYVAQLEDRKGGKTQSFEDPGVQEKIRTSLRTEQFRVLRDEKQKMLQKGAIIRGDDQMLSNALLMTMQRYNAWAGAK